MVAAASLVIGAHGVGAMSLRRLAAKHDVPMGSIYHYFPGGKAQLVDEAIQSTGDRVLELLRAVDPADVRTGVTAMMSALAWVMQSSNFATGCPVAAAVSSEQHRATARSVFESWHREISDKLAAIGLPEDGRESMATTFVAAVEGAIVLSRIDKSSRVLEQVGAELLSGIEAHR